MIIFEPNSGSINILAIMARNIQELAAFIPQNQLGLTIQNNITQLLTLLNEEFIESPEVLINNTLNLLSQNLFTLREQMFSSVVNNENLQNNAAAEQPPAVEQPRIDSQVCSMEDIITAVDELEDSLDLAISGSIIVIMMQLRLRLDDVRELADNISHSVLNNQIRQNLINIRDIIDEIHEEIFNSDVNWDDVYIGEYAAEPELYTLVANLEQSIHAVREENQITVINMMFNEVLINNDAFLIEKIIPKNKTDYLVESGMKFNFTDGYLLNNDTNLKANYENKFYVIELGISNFIPDSDITE